MRNASSIDNDSFTARAGTFKGKVNEKVPQEVTLDERNASANSVKALRNGNCAKFRKRIIALVPSDARDGLSKSAGTDRIKPAAHKLHWSAHGFASFPY